MYKLNISPEVRNDLLEIKGYISKELCNSQAAVNPVSKIIKKIRSLAKYPGIGAPLSSVVDVQTDYRFFVCASYLIFYRYESETVFVTRILYSRRNYIRILFGDLLDNEET